MYLYLLIFCLFLCICCCSRYFLLFKKFDTLTITKQIIRNYKKSLQLEIPRKKK